MSKRTQKENGASTSGYAAGAGRGGGQLTPPASSARLIILIQVAGLATLAALAVAAGSLGAFWMGSVAIIGAPLLIGVIWASATDRLRWAMVGAALCGAAALGLAHWSVYGGAIDGLLAAASPAYFIDMPGAVMGQLLGALVMSSSVLALDNAFAAALIGAVLAATSAWFTDLALRQTTPSWWRHVPAAVALLFICVGMLSSASVSGYQEGSAALLPEGSYGYDAAIYQQAHVLMTERDVGYYQALVTAAAGDARLMQEGAVVDGAFKSWATGPSFIRLPFIFEIWRGARAVGLTVYDLALTVAIAVLIGSYVAYVPYLGGLAIAIPALLYPAFVVHGTWLNIFFADYWAALFSLAAVLFVMRERWLWAGGFALAAALSREVAAIWLVFLVVGALAGLVLDKEKRSWRDLAAYAAAFGVLGAALVLHDKAASAVIAAGTVAIPIVTMLKTSAARALEAKFVAPAGYLMHPYSFYAIPPVVFVLLAPFGYFVTGLGRSWRLRVTILAAAIFWPAFTLSVGATSSYWGQQYTMFAMIGVAALAAWLARRCPGQRSMPILGG